VVVLKATSWVFDGAEVIGPGVVVLFADKDDEDGALVVVLLAVEGIVLEFDACIPSTPMEELATELRLLCLELELATTPPTTAPIAIIVITAIIQNVRGDRPHMRRRGVDCTSGVYSLKIGAFTTSFCESLSGRGAMKVFGIDL